MKLIKSQKLFNGRNEDRDVFIGFEGNDITYISNSKQDGEIIAEGVVTPAFIDAHIRMKDPFMYSHHVLKF
jgi:dihydroorotase-like cyclic amidohydrolase